MELVNALEREKAEGKAGRIALTLMQMDLVLFDALGCQPFSRAGGALQFPLLSKLDQRTSVMITTHLTLAESSSVFGDAKRTTALLERLTSHCQIVGTGNESCRFQQSSATAKTRIKTSEEARRTATSAPEPPASIDMHNPSRLAPAQPRRA